MNQYQYQLLPELDHDEYRTLKEDITIRGVQVPIEIDDKGNILDGHHRKKICDELGIKDYPSIIRIGFSEDEKRQHVLALNLARRHLSPEQRKQLVARLRKEFGWSTRKIAEAVKVHKDTVRNDLSGGENSPARITGKDGKSYPASKPSVIARNQREAEIAQTKLSHIENLPNEIQTVQEVQRQFAKEHAEKSRRELKQPANPSGRFRCIVVDPPWPIEKIVRDVRPNQDIFPYATMTIEEMAMLPVTDLSEDSGCHLYLWTTHKFLPDALRLTDAWGFKYQCLLTWIKNVGFTPFSWMYSTEHILFARKGSLDLLQKGMRLDFQAKVREHSRKPKEFYELIAKASPERRLDMFSREPHEGFESWGAESNKFETAK